VFTLLNQVGHHQLDDVDRDGKAHAAVAGAGAAGFNLRIHANHVAVQVQQRTARVAGVDGGVRLDGLRDGKAGQGRDGAPQRADDAARQRAIQPVGVADCHHRLPHRQAVGIAQHQRLHALRQRIHLHHCQVAVQVHPNHRAGEDGVIGENHIHCIGALHHVGIGDDMPVAVNHKPGTQPLADELPAEVGVHRQVHHRRVDAGIHVYQVCLGIITDEDGLRFRLLGGNGEQRGIG